MISMMLLVRSHAFPFPVILLAKFSSLVLFACESKPIPLSPNLSVSPFLCFDVQLPRAMLSITRTCFLEVDDSKAPFAC